MWCVLELYVFLKMGGSKERIVLKNLAGEDSAAALAKFDCVKAKCYHASDREKILAVIETGFGDTTPFNKIIRGLLSDQNSSKKRSSRDQNAVVSV